MTEDKSILLCIIFISGLDGAKGLRIKLLPLYNHSKDFLDSHILFNDINSLNF